MEAVASREAISSNAAGVSGRTAGFVSAAGTACCIAAPLLLALSSFDFGPGKSQGPLGAVLGTYSLVLWIGALAAMAWLLLPHSPRLAVITAGLGTLGAVGGSNFIFIMMVRGALAAAGVEGAPFSEAAAQDPVGFALVTTIIGPLFPLSLLLFAVALARARVVGLWVGVLLALGAVAFPLGRIPGNVVFIHAADVLLLAAMIPIGLGSLVQRRQGRPGRKAFDEETD